MVVVLYPHHHPCTLLTNSNNMEGMEMVEEVEVVEMEGAGFVVRCPLLIVTRILLLMYVHTPTPSYSLNTHTNTEETHLINTPY